MNTLHEIVDKGKGRIRAKLIDYSAKKNSQPTRLAGQFLDRQGIEGEQFGIYGMSIFLVLTRGIDDPKIKLLQDEIIEKLISWIDKTEEYDLSNQFEDSNDRTNSDKSNIYELRCVIPKICHTLEACFLYDQLSKQRVILAEHLDNAQNASGAFAFLTTDKGNFQNENLINTALVLRTYLIRGDRTRKLNCMNFLKENYTTLNNLFEALYVLNAIQKVIDSDTDLPKDDFSKIKMLIRKNLKMAFVEVAQNPTYFCNPINIDYSDLNRTRSYRLYSDLILIESLAFAYPVNLYYLRGKRGERILNKIWSCLETKSDTDTAQHRLSYGFYFNMSQMLSILITKYNEEIGFFGKLQAKVVRTKFFGINYSREATILGCCSPFLFLYLLINHYYPTAIPGYFSSVIFLILGRVANIFGTFYDNKQKGII